MVRRYRYVRWLTSSRPKVCSVFRVLAHTLGSVLFWTQVIPQMLASPFFCAAQHRMMAMASSDPASVSITRFRARLDWGTAMSRQLSTASVNPWHSFVQHVLFHISDQIISESVWKCLGKWWKISAIPCLMRLVTAPHRGGPGSIRGDSLGGLCWRNTQLWNSFISKHFYI